jgi:hypothetical protein
LSSADSDPTGIGRVVETTESDEKKEEGMKERQKKRQGEKKRKAPREGVAMLRRLKNGKKETVQEKKTEEEGDHVEPNRKRRSKQRPSTGFEDEEGRMPTDASTECV